MSRDGPASEERRGAGADRSRPRATRASSCSRAAERILLRDGPQALTSRAVTTEAGCAKGVLHRHFADFDDFLAELVLGPRRPLEAQAAASPTPPAQGPSSQPDHGVRRSRSVAVAIVGPHRLPRRPRRPAPGPTTPTASHCCEQDGGQLLGAYLAAERYLGRLAWDGTSPPWPRPCSGPATCCSRPRHHPPAPATVHRTVATVWPAPSGSRAVSSRSRAVKKMPRGPAAGSVQAVRILVLGGTSFVGRAIVEDALRSGADVTLFGRGGPAPSSSPACPGLSATATPATTRPCVTAAGTPSSMSAATYPAMSARPWMPWRPGRPVPVHLQPRGLPAGGRSRVHRGHSAPPRRRDTEVLRRHLRALQGGLRGRRIARYGDSGHDRAAGQGGRPARLAGRPDLLGPAGRPRWPGRAAPPPGAAHPGHRLA